MFRKHIGKAIFSVMLLATGIVHADQAISVTADPAISTLVAEHSAGDVLTIPLLIGSDYDAGVFGAELALTAATDDIVIRSVTFAAAFRRSAGDISPTVASAVAAEASSNGVAVPVVADADANALPGPSYRAVRTHPVTALDRSLGANNNPVLLATVEVEIKNSAPFESALNIHARGSLVAAPAEDGTTDDASAQATA